MNLPEAITKYYDLRSAEHVTYVSPVEQNRLNAERRSNLLQSTVDTVNISKCAKIKFYNVYAKSLYK